MLLVQPSALAMIGELCLVIDELQVRGDRKLNPKFLSCRRKQDWRELEQ